MCVLSGAVVRLWRVISGVVGDEGGGPDALRTVRATVPAAEGGSGGGGDAASSALASSSAASSRTIVGVRFPAEIIPRLRLALERPDRGEMGSDDGGRGAGGAGGVLDGPYDDEEDDD